VTMLAIDYHAGSWQLSVLPHLRVAAVTVHTSTMPVPQRPAQE
jgi:hypothetical protein